MSWRELMKTDTHRQNGQNRQKPPETEGSVNIVDIVNRNELEHKSEIIPLVQTEKKPIRALGYGCAGCGNRLYQAFKVWEISELPAGPPWTQEYTPVVHWRCEGCGSVFKYIGGKRGPQPIN